MELTDVLGIKPEARVTTGASVAEHGEHDRDGRWQHRGYRAWNQLVLRVGDASVVGELIAGAVDRGAQVNGPAWTIAPDNPAHAAACREAALDARRRAEAYAEALGARVGAIVAVSDPGTGPPSPPRPLRMAAMDAGAVEALPVEAGEQVVTGVVEVEFQLEQGSA
ncbi:MAG TPA: SIMPL domain-containing protein [Gaiellaceae bacterium]|nr:SIMPL domain-containing protein [Gaiellaceae bacterium]